MSRPPRSYSRLAQGLVLAQFALAAALFLTTPWGSLGQGGRGWLAVGLLGVGGCWAIWAWATMGWRRLRVMPHPDPQGALLQHGPYRWTRHPMYGGLLLASLGCWVAEPSWPRGGLWLCLAGVLLTKLQLEERLLAAHFADYPAYRRRTWSLFPGLW